MGGSRRGAIFSSKRPVDSGVQVVDGNRSVTATRYRNEDYFGDFSDNTGAYSPIKVRTHHTWSLFQVA